MPMFWERGGAQPADGRHGGLQVGEEVSPGPAWLPLETLPGTHLARPPLVRSPSSPCDLSALPATAISRPPASLWST